MLDCDKSGQLLLAKIEQVIDLKRLKGNKTLDLYQRFNERSIDLTSILQ